MKRAILLLSLLIMPNFISGCPAASVATPYPTSLDSNASSYPIASAVPTIAATSIPNQQLDGLRAGVLPDTSFTDEERKLAGVLIRRTTPVFPLKVGVLLYKDGGSLPESDRRNNFDSFIQKIKSNPNIGQVIEISSALINRDASIEDIRKLGSRFQVSSVLVISESYQFPVENNEAVVTPIDLITGARTWQSFSKIEVYGLDVLNGVFIFSTASGAKETDKYNRSSTTVKNPDNLLIRNSAFKAWQSLQDKVSNEITDYKNHFDSDKIIPVVLSPIQGATPTPVSTK